MNLQPIYPSSPPVYITCCRCTRRTSTTVAYANTDGIPFQEYYCPDCAELLAYHPNIDTPNINPMPD